MANPSVADDADGNGELTTAGNANFFGAVVAEGAFVKGVGNVKIIYDPEAFSASGLPQTAARISGTWKDW